MSTRESQGLFVLALGVAGAVYGDDAVEYGRSMMA